MAGIVNYLEQWRRLRDGRIVFIDSVIDLGDKTWVRWRGPHTPGTRTRRGRVELDRFLKTYEFHEPAPELHLPVQFPPDPKNRHELDLVLMMLKSERSYWQDKSNVYRIVMRDELRARTVLHRAAELKAQYQAYEEKWGAPGALPTQVFQPELGGRYAHEKGFTYESWRVREKSPGWEYRIVGTQVKVIEVDGGSSYGLCAAVVCDAEKDPWNTIGGPAQWSIENALNYAHQHWLTHHVFK